VGIDGKARERLEANVTLREVLDNFQEMLRIAPKAVEFPDDERIATATGPQRCRQLGPGHACP
jgi:hypothetical protein